MKAVGKYVVVKKVESVQTGVIVRVRDEQKNEAEVVSVGDEVYLPLSIGDVVLYNGGRAVKYDDVDYVILKDEEILAVVKEGKGVPPQDTNVS